MRAHPNRSGRGVAALAPCAPLLLACALLLAAPAAQQTYVYPDVPHDHDAGGHGHLDGHGGHGELPVPASLPPGFVDEVVLGLDGATGFCFAPDGRMYLWERAGRVWIVEDGALSDEPFLDIRDEVANWGDHGLLGFALDPLFASNGQVYLLYVVDHHHLVAFGTPAYDPALSDDYHDTIGRITRYRADAGDDFRSVIPSSRTVLLGQDAASGFPICSNSHGVGSLVFGADGSLLASCGDGEAAPASGTCLSEGIITPAEDVGSFRAQLLDSVSGKILRLDPRSGEGFPSNPFFDPLAPAAPRSLVWALGVRNPYRFALRPGTGSRDHADGDPGTLLVGDVGGAAAEELSLVRVGGLNLGWPIHEGLSPTTAPPTPNLHAPNPLFGQRILGRGVCTQEFYDFQDLLAQDSLQPPAWLNPCDPGQPLVADVPLFVHTRPVLEWLHDGGARVPVYDAFGNAGVAVLGAPGTPVTGASFGGNASIGGAWYTGTSFPPEYHDTYLHGDFGLGWIRRLEFNGAEQLTDVEAFFDSAGAIVHMGVDPLDGSLYYLTLTFGFGELHRLYVPSGNVPPTAVVASDASWGPTPLEVAFDGTHSIDPDGGALSYRWDFGDGTPPSRLARPVHRFPSEDVTQGGTIIAKVFELDPPGSMGLSNPDPEVIRDGDYPPLGIGDVQRQYDTAHFDESFMPDKGRDDWIGYEFSTPRTFVGLLFQEGTTFALLGGWINLPVVQVRQGGVWHTVADAVSDPVYPGQFFPHYETFEFRFAPVTGDAIRLYGFAAGEQRFFTIGELRVVAVPLDPPAGPVNVDVTLTVTDNAGAEDAATRAISLDNTPPAVAILSPDDLQLYSNDAPDAVDLVGVAVDAEHGPGEVECTWQVILFHDNHNHPGPIVPGCELPALLSADGCPDVHHQEVRFTATDPLGLVGAASIVLLPECDLNHNGVDDALDIASGASRDTDADGVPDEAQLDCNHDGVPDIHQVFLGRVRDEDGNGVPDECELLLDDLTQPGAPGDPRATGAPAPHATPAAHEPGESGAATGHGRH